jgi:hypothetical protein
VAVTWIFVSFLNGKWTVVPFGYMLISEVPLVIESETDVGKNKVVKTKRQKGI